MKKEGTQAKESLSKAEIEKTLIDNFVNLQRVLTNLAVKFDELSTNIEKLLQLFEISAKNFAEKYSEKSEPGEGRSVDKEFLEKLDSLLDQNKTISKGIMLMEEKIRNKNTLPVQEFDERPRMIPRRPLPR